METTTLNSKTVGASVSGSVDRYTEIIRDRTDMVKRFNIRGRKIEFKLKQILENEEPTTWVKNGINEMIQRVMENVDPKDKVGITFCGKSFEERGPGWINFKDAKEIRFKDVWDMISKIFQSNSEGLSTDSFCMGVTSVRLPVGRGKRRNKYSTFEEECTMRRGIVTISNSDHLCLPRAIVVAIAHAVKDPEYNKIRRDVGKIQTRRAVEIINKAHIDIPSEGCGIPELQQLQNYLKAYKIVVYQYGTKGRDVIFEGTNKGTNEVKNLNLLYSKGHYNVITSITAAFCCSYYCEQCHIPYNVKNHHRCGGTCPQCQQEPACRKDVLNILCEECKRYFRGQQCFENHKASGTSGKKNLCEKLRRCSNCLKTYKADREHICGEYFCKNCSKHVATNHQCFIQPDTRAPKLKDTLYIFYDLETRQEKIVENKCVGEEGVEQIKQHEANLCVYQQWCDFCIEHGKENNDCVKCGIKTEILKKDPIENFLIMVLFQRKSFKKVVVIAHNGQAFDHQFILNYILNQTDLQPKLIMRGTKIILMTIENIKFLDSLNYFPMALAKLPKAFDLPPGFKKGYFPHLFNTLKNENYIGCLPPVEYYSPDTMKTEDRLAFLRWYNEHKDDEFDMQKDIVDYCVSDVEILTTACLKFRQLFLEECNVEPFLEAVTIASACNLVYRRNFLQRDTLGLIPKNGYRYTDNQSKEAIQWLILEEEKRKINIHHAAKGREAVVAGVKVDGICEETKQIFEFHGCYYHGHPICLHHRRDEPLHNNPKDTLKLRYERTIEKSERLRKSGYEVIEMWGCEFQRQLSSENLKQFEEHPLIQNLPLNPRDSFYGGRTGNTYNYYSCKEGEKIKYIDVCSLYPYVCKYGKFPLGHPTVHVGNSICSEFNLQNTDGLIKCKILPPEQLLHPILPIKQNAKLMFSLCRTCSENKNQDEFCNHPDDERALIGTWVIDEVVKAIEKGYKLLHIFEIWKYNVRQYDKGENIDGIFTKMMNKFLKMKQEASGWPSKCSTEEQKQKYIHDFLKNEDIKLEFSKISKNSGLRSLAKLMLNSFWGKFGQRENQQKTIIINEPSELYELLTNPKLEICHILPINETNIVVNWEYKEEEADSLNTVNVGVAAYTTTQARLKLYSYLEKLAERVLYYDTDSVIYISREGEYEPPTGDFIGDMTDELECYGSGSYITEFVSGGPKNYAYRVYSTSEKNMQDICKVKGICLNYSSSKKINFNTIKEAVLNSTEREEIYILSQNIRRTKNHEVITVPEIKKYSPNAEKRRFLPDFSSVPYGYKRSRIN